MSWWPGSVSLRSFSRVDAGARNDEPTYFDVCQGTNEKLVVHCGEGHHGD